MTVQDVRPVFTDGMFPIGNFSELPGSGSLYVPARELETLTWLCRAHMFLIGNMSAVVSGETNLECRASETARLFGSMIRQRRHALGLRQEQLALAAGVGRRFLIDLEAGKPSCQLGRSLLVADALGLRLTDVLAAGAETPSSAPPELPDLPEEEDETDVRAPGLL
jgi:y4mF family transcriptional regulator